MFRSVAAMLLGSAMLMTGGCQGPDSDEGTVISEIPLSNDALDVALNLNCADVGIFPETCVLDDPENPFLEVAIVEFDENNEEAFNKFELAGNIPDGPAGAKTRFYFWATALARRPIGENQYYTAVALHEVYSAQTDIFGAGDPIVQAQAIKAYRSMLDNFFSSVVFFTCWYNNGVFRSCAGDYRPGPTEEPAVFAVPLNERTACNLYFQDSEDTQGFARLRGLGEELGCENAPGPAAVDGCYQLAALNAMASWGYAYQVPAGAADCAEGIVTVNDG